MKNPSKILMKVLPILSLFLTSCVKTDIEPALPFEDHQEEGFVSKTGNHDSKIDSTVGVLAPLMHMHYDASFSREEAEASFAIEVTKFLKEQKRTAKAESFLYFHVATKTGTSPNSESNANIWARVNFLTDNGGHQLPWFKLDHTSENEFENGGWDFFYLRVHIQSTNWIEAENAVVALQGTDGWYIKYFDVHLHVDSRYNRASGSSHIFSDPEIWLDNTTWEGWDYYNTGVIGTGRLNF